MHYLITGSKVWADEFNVDFFEIITEEDYKKYMIAKEIFVNFLDGYYFGTNEGWDDKFDYLDFNPIPVSDSDLEALIRLGLVHNYKDNLFTTLGNEVVGGLFTCIEDSRDSYSLPYVCLETCTVEEFRTACKELLDTINNETC